jgi:hypothetical protein
MPTGTAFIKHEFDEAISIQQAMVEATRELARAHPMTEARDALKRLLPIEEDQLQVLQSFGALFDARGKQEDVARAMTGLMDRTLKKAGTADAEESEAYEAHAVLLSLVRKQQDSTASLITLAGEMQDRKLAAGARKMRRELTAATKDLGAQLASFAVRIASRGDGIAAARAAAQGEAQPQKGPSKARAKG